MPHGKYQSCIDACNACAVACNHCLAACLQEPDVKSMARCIALDVDCAEICALAAAALSRASQSSRAVCQACAEACRLCGEECARHKMDHCRECAEACMRCADECRKMAAMA